MRKQIAAANWKMNLSLSQAKQLVSDLQNQNVSISENQQVLRKHLQVGDPLYIITLIYAVWFVARFPAVQSEL